MNCSWLRRSLVPLLPLLFLGCQAEQEAADLGAQQEAASARRPNVVLIYGDDVGYGDVGAYGSKLIPTPNIDALAKQGLRFTDGHCSAATCSPSRFSMLTGIHGFRHGVRVLPPNAPLTIPVDALTLPDVFKAAGYQTAVVGKWHLGLGAKGTPVDWNGAVQPGPLELGFDYSFLLPSTNDRVPCVYLDGHEVVGLDASDPLFVGKRPEGVECTTYPDGKANPEAMTYYRSSHGHNNSVINGIGRIGKMHGGSHALWDDETMADVFVERSVKWIEERDKDTPFFLFFSSQDIHVPRAPHPRFQGKTGLGYRGDAMVALDWAVGAITAALEEQGLADDTIVIFTSDNGPVYDDGYEDGTVVQTSTKEVDQGHDGSGPYRGGKYQIYEGGTRVPFIVRWPGHIEAGVSDALVNQIDFLASFAQMFELPLKESDAIDSRNMLPAFLGHDPSGLPFMIEEARGRAVRSGPWKLIRQKKRVELYDLVSDEGEQVDVSADHPARVEELGALLDALEQNSLGVRGHSAQ
ncbi:MAG: arylsulfatase A [Planctomycetota bacterium]|jgi:arylsulfatase A